MQIILSTTKLIEIYIECDDFMNELECYMNKQSLSIADKRHIKKRKMTKSEMMAIIIFYHYLGFRCFKWYYNHVVKKFLNSYFPVTFSYNRFIQLIGELNLYLVFFMTACRLSVPTQGNYIDSKKLVVCHNRRIKQHKVHKGITKRGKVQHAGFSNLNCI